MLAPALFLCPETHRKPCNPPLNYDKGGKSVPNEETPSGWLTASQDGLQRQRNGKTRGLYVFQDYIEY